jgi:UDP-glucose 4-epimerase
LHTPEAASGHVLNAGGGRDPTTVNSLLALVAKHSGTAPKPVHEPPREGDIRRSHADISRARALIGYEPKYDIDTGIRRTVEWFAQQE